MPPTFVLSIYSYTQGLPSEVGDEALMNMAIDSTFESYILASTPARTQCNSFHV